MFGLGKPRSSRRVGGELSADGATLLVLDTTSQQITAALSTSGPVGAAPTSSNSAGGNLKAFVRQHGLKGAACTVALAPEDYDLLLVEAPKVADQEVKQALRWRVGDMSAIATEEATLDWVRATHLTGSESPMLFVAVARISAIEAIYRWVNESRLTLESVIIPEFAARNLLVACGERNTCTAALMLREGGANIAFFREADLCMSRKFAPRSPGRIGEAADAINAEVSRSLNYFERQLKQPTPARLFVCGVDGSETQVAKDLSGSLPMPASSFELPAALHASAGLATGADLHSLLALGAALEGTLN
jgi:MSHA biogenesis protein MshI